MGMACPWALRKLIQSLKNNNASSLYIILITYKCIQLHTIASISMYIDQSIRLCFWEGWVFNHDCSVSSKRIKESSTRPSTIINYKNQLRIYKYHQDSSSIYKLIVAEWLPNGFRAQKTPKFWCLIGAAEPRIHSQAPRRLQVDPRIGPGPTILCRRGVQLKNMSDMCDPWSSSWSWSSSSIIIIVLSICERRICDMLETNWLTS